VSKQGDYVCPEAEELADKAKTLSKEQLARAIQDLINTAAEQAAGNIFRGTRAANAEPVYTLRSSNPYRIPGEYLRGDMRMICMNDGSQVQEVCIVSGNPGEWRTLVGTER
jgi:hypothetical protein